MMQQIIRIPEPMISLFGVLYSVDEYCEAHDDAPAIVRKEELIRPGVVGVLEQRVPRAFFMKLQDASRADAGWRLPC